MLHRSGAIRLSQERRRKRTVYPSGAQYLRDASHAHLDAIVDGKIRIHFDTHDGGDIATGELDDCDFYFKRSYSPSLIATLPLEQRSRIEPLGLNYRVLPSSVDWFAVRRGLSLRDRPLQRALKEAFDPWSTFGYKPRIGDMESPPEPDAEPRVLFLAAAYDPNDDPGRTQDKIEDRTSINESRALCIRLLKAALGERFTGGFAASEFARKRYPDLTVPASVTAQASYIATMRAHPICVATTGLHGSIGWKLAEYVAFSKAIMTEKLLYRVTGDFAPNRNYLEFSEPEDCAAAAVRLVEDRDLRERLMLNNAAYYRAYVRPDALVGNALARARGVGVELAAGRVGGDGWN